MKRSLVLDMSPGRPQLFRSVNESRFLRLTDHNGVRYRGLSHFVSASIQVIITDKGEESQSRQNEDIGLNTWVMFQAEISEGS